MGYVEPSQINNPGSSPSVADLASYAPLALAFLAIDGGAERYGDVKRELRRVVKDDPIDALVATVLGGGLAFYLAEREHNAACRSPWDGILYIATALSVGYDNLFPTTPTGHLIASAVQTFGPALANAAFDPPAAETRAIASEAAAVNRAILARLEDIVRLLEAGA